MTITTGEEYPTSQSWRSRIPDNTTTTSTPGSSHYTSRIVVAGMDQPHPGRTSVGAPSTKAVPHSARPNASPRSTHLVVDSEALVTSPTTYQGESMRQSLIHHTSPYQANSMQAEPRGAGSTYPPIASSAGSSSPTLQSQMQGSSPSASTGGGLSRAKSVANSSAAARQGLLQQQKYQQQRQEEFMRLTQSYSSNTIPTITSQAEPNADASAHVSPSSSEETMSALPEESVARPATSTGATEIPASSSPSLPRAEPRSGSISELQPTLTPIAATFLQQRVPLPDSIGMLGHGGQARDNPPANLSSAPAESTPMTRTRVSTIQLENTQPPSSSQRQRQGQQQQRSDTFGSGLARAGTISSSGSAAANANFITHFVPKKSLEDVQRAKELSHIEEGPGPVMLIAIGKTGQGKSSLLNRIMGTNELKTSASVRAVTKGIAERTGWAKFEDNRRFLVTLADTPGLADTEGDDEKNIPILKDYINSVGTRLGVTAFLLVFKIDSSVDNIMAILKTFNDIMHDFPNVWDNVILVFTGCDYRREILDTKQLLHRELKKQILENILQNPPPRPSVPTEPSTSSTATCSSMEGPSGSTSSPSASRSATTFENTDSAVGVPMVFLTTAENICLIALGGAWCDCEEHAQYMKTALKRLWYEARKMKRWVIDADEGDYEFIGHA